MSRQAVDARAEDGFVLGVHVHVHENESLTSPVVAKGKIVKLARLIHVEAERGKVHKVPDARVVPWPSLRTHEGKCPVCEMGVVAVYNDGYRGFGCCGCFGSFATSNLDECSACGVGLKRLRCGCIVPRYAAEKEHYAACHKPHSFPG